MTRKVVILRGASGSGKSTYIKNHLPDAYVCSADHYFEKSGKYVFDVNKLPAAHEECKRKFRKALKEKLPLIVVDNTNTKWWEMKPYVLDAHDAGYEVEFVRLETPVDVAAKRNLHNVPFDAVQKMANRMQDLPGEWGRKEKKISGV